MSSLVRELGRIFERRKVQVNERKCNVLRVRLGPEKERKKRSEEAIFVLVDGRMDAELEHGFGKRGKNMRGLAGMSRNRGLTKDVKVGMLKIIMLPRAL